MRILTMKRGRLVVGGVSRTGLVAAWTLKCPCSNGAGWLKAAVKEGIGVSTLDLVPRDGACVLLLSGSEESRAWAVAVQQEVTVATFPTAYFETHPIPACSRTQGWRSPLQVIQAYNYRSQQLKARCCYQPLLAAKSHPFGACRRHG